jgi:hypothetical protein
MLRDVALGGARMSVRIRNPIHGTRARYVGGCRCDECKQANSNYQRMVYNEGTGAGGQGLKEGKHRSEPAELQGWIYKGECRQYEGDPDDFFVNQRNTDRRDEVTPALKRLCATCPVFDECRQYVDALESGVSFWQTHGFWAGEWEADRARRRGVRVRKNGLKCCGHPRSSHYEQGCLVLRCDCEADAA